MYVLILLAALTGGTGEGNNLNGFAPASATFKNLASCEAALTRVVAETDGAVGGICVPQKVKKVKVK
jgi:hypothetical protein